MSALTDACERIVQRVRDHEADDLAALEATVDGLNAARGVEGPAYRLRVWRVFRAGNVLAHVDRVPLYASAGSLVGALCALGTLCRKLAGT